ncbi:MAG: hypothetical protein AAF705_00040, partial [Bacteroidota bacterium]
MKQTIGLLFLSLLLLKCESNSAEQAAPTVSIFDQVRQLPDSISAEGIVVYNLFKYQILAHENAKYDSLLIVKNVYETHQEIWDELYAVLFNQEMFSTPEGMMAWNKQLFLEQRDTIESKVNQLLGANFTQKLNEAITNLEMLTGRTPENVRLSIILAPFMGIGFGGITNDAFIMDLLDPNFDVLNMVVEGIPHELNHFIYDPTRKDDPHKDTPLRLTIDEGFACYYTYK